MSPSPSQDPTPPHPLFNTTYTLHRLTPLHSFPLLTPSALAPHARTLATHLRGDVLRGVQISASDVPSTFKSCAWLPLPSPAVGVEIRVEYETASYSVLLLEDDDDGRKKPGFTNLPLMLSRLPKSLRETVITYLESTFDTSVAALVLPSSLLRNWLSAWVGTDEASGGEVRIVFGLPSADCRTCSVSIPGGDVVKFWELGNGGWKRLEEYFLSTMGIEIKKWDVRKIVCSGFVVQGGEGAKWKGFEPGEDKEWDVMQEVVGGLIELARGRSEL